MTIYYWINTWLSKLTTRWKSHATMTLTSRLPTPAISQTPVPPPCLLNHGIPTPLDRQPTARKDHYPYYDYYYHHHHHHHHPCRASEATRGWRIPRFTPTRSPARHDRHSTHCIAAGTLFSAVKLTARGPWIARRKTAWNRPIYSEQPKVQTSEHRSRKADHVPVINSRCDEAFLGPSERHTTPPVELFARDGKDRLEDDWNGGRSVMAQGWIAMTPIISRA